MNATLALVIAGFVLVIYVPIVVVFWRNVNLSQPWKATFSLTIFPLFVVAMGFNIWFTNEYAGWLLDYLASAKARGSIRSEIIAAFMASTPIALLICLVWYGLIRALDSLTTRRGNA